MGKASGVRHITYGVVDYMCLGLLHYRKSDKVLFDFLSLILLQSFVSLAVMRGLQGVAAAPIETLVTSTVSDLFFVHQRGQKLAIWGSSILVGVMLG